MIAVSPKGLMFLNAIDCNGELKDAPFIANILFDAIESVGSSNVLQSSWVVGGGKVRTHFLDSLCSP